MRNYQKKENPRPRLFLEHHCVQNNVAAWAGWSPPAGCRDTASCQHCLPVLVTLARLRRVSRKESPGRQRTEGGPRNLPPLAARAAGACSSRGGQPRGREPRGLGLHGAVATFILCWVKKDRKLRSAAAACSVGEEGDRSKNYLNPSGLGIKTKIDS